MTVETTARRMMFVQTEGSCGTKSSPANSAARTNETAAPRISKNVANIAGMPCCTCSSAGK